ncbi:hypothetical protein D3C85_796620 [compost metagenome]
MGDFRQWIGPELTQAEPKQTFGLQQYFDFIQVQGDLVGFVFPGQLIQRCGQFDNRQNPGHRRTALEGVQGTQQLVTGLQRHMFGGLFEEAIETAQMGFGFFAEDLQQQRIECRDVLRVLIGDRLFTLGQGMGASRQLVDIIALALGIGGVFSHQLRQQVQHITEQLLHRSARFHAVFQYAVEQVLHGPGQFAEHQRADHATTALEGMEGAAQFTQSRAVVGIDRPARQILAKNFQDFIGFFEEHFAQFIVHRFLANRRRQQAARCIQGGRVQGRDRAGEHIGQGLDDGRSIQLLALLHDLRFAGAQHIVKHRHMLFAGLFIREEAERGQAFFRHVEQLFAGRLGVVAEALKVIFEAGDDVGKTVEFLPAGLAGVEQQMFADEVIAGFDQARGAAQRNHRQRATHLGQQGRQCLQMLTVPVGVDVVDDHVLGLLQADACFLDHDLMDLRQVGGRQATVFLALGLHRTDHAGQRGFDVEQSPGDVHEDRVIRRALALGEAQHHRQLIDDDLARLAETQHRQGVGDLPQRRQQAVEIGGVLPVAAHEQVQALLDPYQFFAQRGQYRTHGIAVRTGQPRAFFIDHRAVGQRIVQSVAIFHGQHLPGGVFGLGNVKQQTLEQLRRRRLIDGTDALFEQTLEFLVGVLEQAAQGRTVGDRAAAHAFDQRRSDLPQWAQRRVAAQAFETGKDLGKVTEVGVVILFAQ